MSIQNCQGAYRERIEFVWSESNRLPINGALSAKANASGIACTDPDGCRNGGTDCMVDGLHVDLEEETALASECALELSNSLCDFSRTLVEACNEGDIGKVQKLLNEGRVSVHDTTEEGESLLSLACSAGYFELAQVRTFTFCLKSIPIHN